jgi:hypothetical protein
VQEVAHADLGLGDDFNRSFLERSQCEFGTASSQSGADYDRRRHFLHNFPDESQSVHSRHFEVGNNHVGRFLLHLRPCNQGVCRDADLDPAVGAQDALHNLAHHRGVIYYQHVQVISMHTRHALSLRRHLRLRNMSLHPRFSQALFVSCSGVDRRLKAA